MCVFYHRAGRQIPCVRDRPAADLSVLHPGHKTHNSTCVSLHAPRHPAAGTDKPCVNLHARRHPNHVLKRRFTQDASLEIYAALECLHLHVEFVTLCGEWGELGGYPHRSRIGRVEYTGGHMRLPVLL